jgi:hypothetical protein
MATNLKTSTDAVVLTRFYGGERDKVCVQVNSREVFGHVRLTRDQARALAKDLMDFAAGAEEEDFG